MKPTHKYSPKRLAWLCLGVLCVGLAIIGAVLPLMPTTVFLLVAAFAFARSSPKLHAWLLEHKVFGPLIQNWQTHGAISKKAKYTSVISMIAILVLSWGLGVPIRILVIQIVVLGMVAAFLLTRPNPPKG